MNIAIQPLIFLGSIDTKVMQAAYTNTISKTYFNKTSYRKEIQ